MPSIDCVSCRFGFHYLFFFMIVLSIGLAAILSIAFNKLNVPLKGFGKDFKIKTVKQQAVAMFGFFVFLLVRGPAVQLLTYTCRRSSPPAMHSRPPARLRSFNAHVAPIERFRAMKRVLGRHCMRAPNFSTRVCASAA